MTGQTCCCIFFQFDITYDVRAGCDSSINVTYNYASAVQLILQLAQEGQPTCAAVRVESQQHDKQQARAPRNGSSTWNDGTARHYRKC